MKASYKKLLEKSVSAALSAIEIYNKPDFKYRGEIFSILIINAWELLLKSKILKDNKNSKSSIYIKDNRGKFRKNRFKKPLTIDLLKCIEKLELKGNLRSNLLSLIDIRDNAIHFYNDSDVDNVLFQLSVASLKNFQKLCKEWFNRDLSNYNFYILPLGFSYNLSLIHI